MPQSSNDGCLWMNSRCSANNQYLWWLGRWGDQKGKEGSKNAIGRRNPAKPLACWRSQSPEYFSPDCTYPSYFYSRRCLRSVLESQPMERLEKEGNIYKHITRPPPPRRPNTTAEYRISKWPWDQVTLLYNLYYITSFRDPYITGYIEIGMW